MRFIPLLLFLVGISYCQVPSSIPTPTGLTTLSNGYVGIGTSTPQAVLDVNGQIDLLGVQGIAYPTVDTTANGSIAIGSGAATSLPASAAYGTTIIGYQALGGIGLTTAAVNNTALGFQALLANTTGSNSTCIGYFACLQTTTTTNTAVGWKALSTGNSNSSVAVGFQALQAAAITNGTAVGNNSCVTCAGTGDTVVGTNAGRFISSGARNVAFGQNALQGVTGSRVTGADNTAIGDQALIATITTGAGNTAIGSQSLKIITTGTNNTAVGNNVGSVHLQTGNNVILIGTSATCDTSGGSIANETHLCGSAADSMTITGTNTVGTEVTTHNGTEVVTQTGSGTTLTVTNSAGSCTHTPGASSETVACSSDQKLKDHIKDAHWYSSWVWSFHIRDFVVKKTGEHKTGVIAQEVQRTHPEMVHNAKDPATNETYLMVDEPNPWVLMKAIQELQAMVVGLFLMVIASFGFTWYRTRA